MILTKFEFRIKHRQIIPVIYRFHTLYHKIILLHKTLGLETNKYHTILPLGFNVLIINIVPPESDFRPAPSTTTICLQYFHPRIEASNATKAYKK